MQIYVCDDELPILEKLAGKVKEHIPEETVFGVSSGRELLHRLQESGCDILFLDIDMPDIDGMEVAKQLNQLEEKPLLVFVSSHDELVYESFWHHPFGFIH